MGSDLIALIGALGLAAAVVVVGLRRNLSETTRANLPRFGGDPGRPSVVVGPPEGVRRRRALSRRQARWLALAYLLIGISNLARAVLSSDYELLTVTTGALFVLGAVLLFLGKLPYASGVR